MKIGFTCSCFDLFHAGHIMMLKEAKTQCDYLIVGLQTDPTIDRPYKNKPIQSILERYIQVEACKYVDQIIPYATEKDLLDLLASYPIDVRIIGEEYKNQRFTGYDLPMAVYFNSRQHSFSSTELRERIAQTEVLRAQLSAEMRDTK
jgi:glycerol-3-phosphate cytidylyltransferase